MHYEWQNVKCNEKRKKKGHSVEFESFFVSFALSKNMLNINSLLVSIACTKMMFYGF